MCVCVAGLCNGVIHLSEAKNLGHYYGQVLKSVPHLHSTGEPVGLEPEPMTEILASLK